MNMLRPDELANQSEIKRAESFKNLITSGAKTALGVSASSKIMPFLSEYVPSDIAVKGISKLFPKIGEFLKNGQKMGLDVKDGLNFVKENLSKEIKKEPVKENRNIIEQYSPSLFQFIKSEIQKGQNPLAAGAIAQNKKEYEKDIKKMEKDHKTSWSNILQTVFGTSEQISQLPNQSALQGQQQMQQPGQGQQALMAILQKIAQTRGQQ